MRLRRKLPPLAKRKHAFRLSLLTLLVWQVCQAEEIAPFRLTGIDGYVLVDYLSDSVSTDFSDQKQSNLREEIFVMSHSYVFHPNFLMLDIGGGPIRQDSSLDLNGNETSAGENLYNLTARASFLRDKPVRGSLFYDHLNPTVSVAPGEIMVQESSRYGFDFSLSGSKTAFPLNLGYVHTRTQGSGAGRVLDDELEQLNLNLNRSWDAYGSTSLQYQSSEQTSRSGSLNLPIQTSTSASQGLNLNTYLQFGASQQYSLINNITFNRRQYTIAQIAQPDQNDLGFLLDFRGRPSGKLSLYGTYNHNRNDQGLTRLVAQTLAGGFTYLPLPDLETSLGARAEQSDADQYTSNVHALDGSLRYKRQLWLGSLQASYAAKYEQRDQQAANPLVDVFDELHTLPGTTQVPLNNRHVVAGSVVVTNLTQTQTYVENVDYLLVVVGEETRVQRLASGSILDGENVLVDYTYDIGGSYASVHLDQTFNLNWNIARNVDAYFRWFDSSSEITSGVSSFPLNQVSDVLLGMRAEMPLNLGVVVGGSYELEDRNETISPYQRGAGDVYVQTTGPLFGLANMRLTMRRNQTNYERSDNDVDLTGYEARAWARRFGIDLVGVLNYEQDVGGPRPSRRRDASLNAVWRERKVTVTASFTYSQEMQGDYTRDHTLFRLTARRDF